MRYLIIFAYDGSKFHGYQKQNDVNSVQEQLESKLTIINDRKPVYVSASGRTDAGVHAIGQCAHFDLDISISEDKLKMALNSMLDGNIYVKSVKKVPNHFHARFDVKRKEYVYKINLGEYNPIEKDYVYQYNKSLDIENMEKAIKLFIGEHSFESFTKANVETENFVRHIFETEITKHEQILELHFIGSGFLRYMVRNMVGTLIEVGEGKRRSEDIIKILDAKNRIKAGKTANPEGLYLRNVFY